MSKPRRLAALLALSLWPLPFHVHAQDAPPPESAAEEDEPRGLILNAPGAFPGYTLISPLSSTEVFLLDMQGEVVHRWEAGEPGAGGYYLLDDGRLLYGARLNDNPRFRGGGIGGRLKLFDWDGSVLWSWDLADDFQTHHHDVEPMPNGNVLVIAWEHRYREDAIEMGRVPSAVGEAGMWPDAVLEIRPIPPDEAEIVWEWHAWDHLVQDHDPDARGYGSVPDSPGRLDVNYDYRAAPAISEEERQRQAEVLEQMRALGYVGDEEEEAADEVAGEGMGNLPDWMHTNSIDYHPELDLILLSSPELDEIFVIDHGLSSDDAAWDAGGRWDRGGEILWRWGNPANFGLGTAEDRRLFYQHHPTWLFESTGAPAGELRVLVFNNGGGRPGGDRSSVEELVLPFDEERGFLREDGQPFGPAELAWSYEAPGEFFSAFISGCQRLPNGNTLICSGAPGRVFEVTRAGEIVWEYRNPFSGEADQGPGGNAPPHALFRATRIPLDHPALRGRDL